MVAAEHLDLHDSATPAATVLVNESHILEAVSNVEASSFSEGAVISTDECVREIVSGVQRTVAIDFVSFKSDLMGSRFWANDTVSTLRLSFDGSTPSDFEYRALEENSLPTTMLCEDDRTRSTSNLNSANSSFATTSSWSTRS